MKLSRKNNSAEAESDKRFLNVESYIRFVINLYSVAEIHLDYWLTEREKDFYVTTVVNCLAGDNNPYSESSIQRYKKYFNYKVNNSSISDYLNRLKRKEWIRYNKRDKVVTIAPIFDGISLSGDKMEFKIEVEYEIDRSDVIGDN